MKAVGSIALLLAAMLGWFAFNNFKSASDLEAEIKNQAGFASFLGEGLGLNNIDRVRIRQFKDTGTKFAVGAGIVAFVGLIMCGSGGKKD